MSIIQQIRDKAAILLTSAIALSLIGFLVQDAFVGKSSGLFNNQAGIVGSVNGNEIDINDFNAKVNIAEQGYRQQGMQSSEMMTQNIIDNIWNSYVQEEVVRSAAEKLGLSLTSKELGTVLFSEDAPQEFKQLFTDQNTGQYNIEAAKTWFNNLKKSKKSEDLKMVDQQLISPMHIRSLMDKYNAIFTNGVYVPNWLIEKMNSDNSSFASVSFAAIPYATISDSIASLKVSDQEITEYVNKHKEEFKQEKTRSVAYVVFDANPTAADTNALIGQLNNLKPEFEATTDAKAFVTRNNSTIQFYDWYTLKSKLQMANKESLGAMPLNSVIGPYLDAGAYVLAKKIEIRNLPDSVKCRHILIGVVDPQTGQELMPDSSAKKLADSLLTAIKSGGNFGALAAQFSTDKGSNMNGGEYTFASTTNLDPAFRDFIFLKKPGDREVVKSSFGYHIIEVLSQKNFEEAFKIAYLAKKIVASEETDNAAEAAAIQFSGNARNQKGFEDQIKSKNLMRRMADNIREMDFSVSGMPNRSLVKWIYDNKPGTVSDVFDMGDQYLVAMVTGENKEGTQSASTARIMVEPILRNQKKAKEIIKKIGAANTLENIAAAGNGQVSQVDTLRFSDPFVQGLGSEPKVIGAAFNKANLSKVSAPIDGQTGVYYIRVNSTGALSGLGFDVKQQKQAMEGQLKQFAAYSTFEALRKSAKIKDERRQAGY